MPGPSDIALGNAQLSMLLQITISPAEVLAATTDEQAFTLRGLQVGDFVSVQKPTAQAGLGLAGSRVSAADTLAITFVNATEEDDITPTAGETYLVHLTRRENPGPLPTALV